MLKSVYYPNWISLSNIWLLLFFGEITEFNFLFTGDAIMLFTTVDVRVCMFNDKIYVQPMFVKFFKYEIECMWVRGIVGIYAFVA